MANQKATRDVVDLVTRPITQGIRVEGDGSANFRIDGTGIGLTTPNAAAFTTINMSGTLDMNGQRITDVPAPVAGTDVVNRDYVNTEDASNLVSANAYTDSQISAIPPPPPSVPAGAIMSFGGAAAPTGWLMCDGSAYSSVTYPDLFAAIGPTFGTNTPDLRGRVAAGPDGGAGRLVNFSAVLGAGAGSDTQTPHTHTYSGNTSVAHSPSSAEGGNGDREWVDHAHSYSGTTSANSTGLGKVQPTMILNYIIKT